MSKIVVYDVLRGHEGDRYYGEGDTRELPEGDALQLVGLGVLKATDKKPKGRKGGDTLEDLRSNADIEIEKIKSSVVTIQVAADDEIAKIKQGVVDARAVADAELDGFKAEVTKQREAAEAEITDIGNRLNQARDDMSVQLGRLDEEIASKKAELASLAAVEPPPDNKAENASPRNGSEPEGQNGAEAPAANKGSAKKAES